MTKDEFEKHLIDYKTYCIRRNQSTDDEEYDKYDLQFKQTRAEILAEFNRLTARVSELENIISSIGKDIGLLEWRGDKNSIELIVQHPLFTMFSLQLADMFIQSGASNFLSIEGFNEQIGYFEFLIQRTYGKTQAQIIKELKARIAELEAIQRGDK